MTEKVCQQCDKVFKNYDKKRKFCSVICSRKGQARKGTERKGKLINCRVCDKQVYRHPSTINRQCCSKKCANKYISELYKTHPVRLEIIHRIRKNRDYTNLEHRAHMSEKIKEAYTEGKLKPKRGADSPFWKGGIANDQNLARASAEYKAWRTAVYTRDNFQCQECGTNQELHAHHIKTFSKHPDLRYEISNGITLCRTHHGEVHGRPLPNIGVVRHKMKQLNKEA